MKTQICTGMELERSMGVYKRIKTAEARSVLRTLHALNGPRIADIWQDLVSFLLADPDAQLLSDRALMELSLVTGQTIQAREPNYEAQ